MNAREQAVLDWVHARTDDEATEAVCRLANHLVEERRINRGDFDERWVPGDGVTVPGEWEPVDPFAEPWSDAEWEAIRERDEEARQ